MLRFFITLGWIMLLLLLVDSAMNDPDVRPIVDHQIQRAGDTLGAVFGWFRSRDAASSVVFAESGSDITDRLSNPDSPASNWYWSTMLGTAVVLMQRAKLAQVIMLRLWPVTAPVSRNQGIRLADRLA